MFSQVSTRGLSHPVSLNVVNVCVFIIYCLLLFYSISHHELWGDELHSWNIAKASGSFSDLISNTRYECHPPLWYTILWIVSKTTHDVQSIQFVQFLIAVSAVFIVIFFSPFPRIIRLLIPFGYFFLFEYGVLSRNYAIGVLLVFIICFIVHKTSRLKNVLYYCLLFLLSNTHLVGLILAASLHLYFLSLKKSNNQKATFLFLHLLLGIIILLPAVYFIMPPPDSGLNSSFWIDKWNFSQITALSRPPLYAFIPIPAWWNYHFWNTEVLLELQSTSTLVKIISLCVLVILFSMLFSILKKNRKSLLLFAANLFLSLAISIVVPLTTYRYAGFIFIGFLAAYWLYCYETPVSRINKRLVVLLLIIQLAGGMYASIRDIQLPFSNGDKVGELLTKIPAEGKVVTDYWTLNTLAAFADKPFYCVEMKKEMSFLLWNYQLSVNTRGPHRYVNGYDYFFTTQPYMDAYMISSNSPDIINRLDSSFFRSYKVDVIDKREGAIEKWSNLYLYKICRIQKH